MTDPVSQLIAAQANEMVTAIRRRSIRNHRPRTHGTGARNQHTNHKHPGGAMNPNDANEYAPFDPKGLEAVSRSLRPGQWELIDKYPDRTPSRNVRERNMDEAYRLMTAYMRGW